MTLSLRRRIVLSFVPLGVLLAVLGGIGLNVLFHTGGRIDAILRENFVSVQAMYRLTEAMGRTDASFRFALAGRGDDAERDFTANWAVVEEQFRIEEDNVTIFPEEPILVDKTGAIIPITVSIGLAERGASGDADSLYRRADRALYRSKTDGRNRVSADAA